MARQMHRRRRRQMADINVVPYIDVMLVLLVIFMITTPLLSRGVKVELPQAPAEPLSATEEPIIVNVDRDGRFYINYGADQDQPVSAGELVKRVRTLTKHQQPKIYIGGDAGVAYGRVVRVMVLLQGAGVQNLGMITEPEEESGSR